jgi:DNA-directed RNA polymerase specialized sigma subunit
LWYDDESKEDRHGEHIYALNVLLSQLKPQERLIIELFYLDGFKDKEVIALNLTNYRCEVVLRIMRKRAMQKLKNMASSMGKMGYA